MKIKTVWIALSLICGLTACKSDEKPPGVLNKEKFAEVLVEMYAGEAKFTSLPIISDSAIKLFQPFEELTLKKKGIPDSIMKITYRYYVNHPIELEAVYDIAIDTLSLREQRAGVRPK